MFRCNATYQHAVLSSGSNIHISSAPNLVTLSLSLSLHVQSFHLLLLGFKMKPSVLVLTFLGRVGALLPLPPAPQPNIATLSLDTLMGSESRFSQLIDHSNPSLGTFSQRYWWDTTYWDGPGSPVFPSPFLVARGQSLKSRTGGGIFSRRGQRRILQRFLDKPDHSWSLCPGHWSCNPPD